jgi:SAM-dependent methyltransferase
MSNKWQNIIGNILEDEQIKKIKDMLNNFKKYENMEFEISFRKISYQNFMRISEKYIDLTDEKNISSMDSLDILIILSNNNTYRISILDQKMIESFIHKFSRSNIKEIQRYVLELNPNDNIHIIYKNRGSADKLYVDNLDIIFKLTEEIPLQKKSDKPKINVIEKIIYRYKNRYSFVINNNIRIDITEVKKSNQLNNLTYRFTNYEIEMEIINHDIDFDILMEELISSLKIIQDSQIPIGKLETNEVINKYHKLLNTKPSHHLEIRNSITLEQQHIIKFIPNKYAITDKADGERHLLFLTTIGQTKTINAYLLSGNLEVKKIDLEIKNKKYNNTILDGELVDNENGYLFFAFDIIYADNIDYRTNEKYNLTYRINILNHIIDECFGNLVPFIDYTDKYNDLEPNKIKEYYQNEVKKYWNLLWKELKKSQGKIFVTRKLYFVPYGIDSFEIFMYADLVWKQFVYGQLPPYKLDGIIYTPINSPYMIKVIPDNLDMVPLEYKWKPPHLNSIDFYIRFEKDAYGNDAIFYDNSEEGRAYKICRLYVGTIRGGEEKPVLFRANGIEQVANIYLINDDAVDINENVVSDKTVVEFVYDITKTNLDDAYRWIPLRTRYDKTESVRKFRKKYGNNINVATRIWRTIINPITEETIASLGNPLTYQKEVARMLKGLEIEIHTKENFIYYQKKTANAAGMRAFNNWIKSNMILTYCRNKQSILDIGCGRGGDLIKFIHAGIKEYVGVDIDNNGLYVINDSAYNRYQNIKRKHKNVPLMHFIHADARALFITKAQSLALPMITTYNKKLIELYLTGNKKYDVINCQFSIHYYLSDELSWNNFCKNVKDHLADNGYFLVTCFDGKMVYDKLYGKPKMTISYTDNMGHKDIFFEIIKKYDDGQDIGTGMAIDLYNSLISNPGTYITEYLVFPDFLKNSLKKNVGLELVESDSFYGIFNFYRNFFTQETIAEYQNIGLPKQYNEIKNFYLSLSPGHDETTEVDAALASFKFTMLNRYYIFKKETRKSTTNEISELSRINGINSKLNMGKILASYFETNGIIIDINEKSPQINKIYHRIRKEYPLIRPSVYLIRHIINKEHFNIDRLEFSKIKNGTDPKILLIYKSPEKYFYPIYYQPNTFDFENLTINKREYLLDSNKIISDIDILVALSEKIKHMKDI